MTGTRPIPPPSVQLYSVRDALADDPAGTLRRIAEIGFTRVEPYDLPAHADMLRDELPRNGLAAPTAHAALLNADSATVFATAASLGVGIVIEPCVPAERWTDPVDVAATADGLNALVPVAADHGLAVGYHNHWWELAHRHNGRTALELLADRLDPAVVLEVDVYWAAAGGADTPALLGRLGERVHAIHVKDGDPNRNGDGQVPPGQGRIPIGAVLAAAGTALPVVEFDHYDGDIFTGLAAGLAQLLGGIS